MTTRDVDALCHQIETFFEDLRASDWPEDTTFSHVLDPHPDEELDEIETELSTELPDDVRAFLSRGLDGLTAAVGIDGEDLPFASVGFDWMGASKIVESTAMMRGVGEGDDNEHANVMRSGIYLTWEEPQIVVADQVYLFSFRNPLLAVADDFGSFLEHWLASGCFASHHFPVVWERVEDLVPVDISLEQNTWLQAYESQHPEYFED